MPYDLIILDPPAFAKHKNVLRNALRGYQRLNAKALEKRFTCTGSASVFVPHTASDITTTSVIAAMEVREAMKAASDRQDLCTEGVTYYDGTAGEMFTLELDKDPQCPNHTED